MGKTGSIADITRNGIVLANRIRMVTAAILILIIGGAATENSAAINIAYFSGLSVFIILAIVNNALTKRGLRSAAFQYVTALVEISLPTLMKSAHALAGRPHMMMNESTVFPAYLLFIALTLLQNRRSLTLAVGAAAALQYATLVCVGVFVFDLPVKSGDFQFGHIIIDDEMGKIVILAGFTLICGTILKNMSSFARRALEQEDMAKKRAGFLEEVIASLGGMNLELSGVSDAQREVCSKLAGVSQDQAAMSEELSSIHEEQLASIESISLSMNDQSAESDRIRELVRSLQESQHAVLAESAELLRSIETIGESSRKTGGSLADMNDTMRIISQGGEAIASFIGVINDITDRINLLSLNAAIEAARAGEHGRGFAVVADEIGKLALATSDNAKEISDRVGRIGTDIGRGVRLVQATLDAIGEVLALIDKSGDSIDSVRGAMRRQDEYIGAVGTQSAKLDTLSKSILTSTGEQQSSMQESASSIQKIAELAQTIAAHNQEILDTADVIASRAGEMKKLMEEIRDDENSPAERAAPG